MNTIPQPPSDQSSLLTWALFYASMGWPVFPCLSTGKEPLVPGGLYDASTDPDQIQQWWERWPSANIGCPCGPSAGFKNDEGRQGYGSDHDAIDIEPSGIPVAQAKGDQLSYGTVVVKTPSGGFHCLVSCRSDVKNAVRPVEGIDVRTAKGYTLLPPSFVVEESKGYEGWYEWRKSPWDENGNIKPLPEMPGWLIEAANKKSNGKSASLTSLNLTQGSRNSELFRYACRLRSECMEHVEIEAALRSVNQYRCSPPLSDKDIATIASQAAKYKPGQATKAVTDSAKQEPSVSVDEETGEILSFPLTDAGNAERMAHMFGKDLKYCAQWGKWLVWNGWKWEISNDGCAHVYQIALQTVRAIQEEAVQATDPDRRKALGTWGFKCEDKRKLDSMVLLCAKIKGIPVSTNQLDAHTHILNLRNGVYNLTKQKLFPHDRKLLLTRGIDVEYDKESKCPTWQSFLMVVLGESPDLLRYVWKAVGYSLDGSCSEQCFFFVHGNTGNNGKSTFIETILSLFGDYAKQTSTDTLMAKFGDPGISNDIARLKDARIVAAPETEDGRRLNEGLIKRLTGGDTITARFMHQEFFEFKPQFKVWVSGNHRPEIRGTDDAIWRRVKLIPFQVTVPAEDRDPYLKDKLTKELPGILAWAISGHQAWRQERLGAPDEIQCALGDYRESQDRIGTFLAECTTASLTERVKSSSLYSAYQNWCKRSGEFALSARKFGEAMRERGQGSKDSGGFAWYSGIELSTAETQSTVYRGGD
jgi:putative DNA primase/helicase